MRPGAVPGARVQGMSRPPGQVIRNPAREPLGGAQKKLGEILRLSEGRGRTSRFCRRGIGGADEAVWPLCLREGSLREGRNAAVRLGEGATARVEPRPHKRAELGNLLESKIS
jgi:hypothetical protein